MRACKRACMGVATHLVVDKLSDEKPAFPVAVNRPHLDGGTHVAAPRACTNESSAHKRTQGHESAHAQAGLRCCRTHLADVDGLARTHLMQYSMPSC